MIPQALLNAEEIENFIKELCKDKNQNKRREIDKFEFENKLIAMTKANQFEVVFNGYFGLASLATFFDNNKSLMIKYMDILEKKYPQFSRVYSGYSWLCYFFEDDTLAKEKLLKALECPILTEEDFMYLSDNALILQYTEIYAKILEKCKNYHNNLNYKELQMELGDFDISLFENKDKYTQINLQEFFSE